MMADQRRELEALRATLASREQNWQARERHYLNQIEQLERQLKAARDELAEARQTIVDLKHLFR